MKLPVSLSKRKVRIRVRGNEKQEPVKPVKQNGGYVPRKKKGK